MTTPALARHAHEPSLPVIGGPGVRLGCIAFFVAMYVVIVTLAPFRIFDAYASLVEARGDPIRQAVMLFAFILAMGAVLQAYGLRALRAVPVGLIFICAWIVLSLAWSIAPDLAVRRTGLFLTLTLTIYASTLVIGYERAARMLIVILVPVILIDLISVVAAPLAAVHQASERNLDLVGSWRGMHTHKNNAAPVAVLAAILFSSRVKNTGSGWIFGILTILALVFLWGTHSRTTGAFGIAALLLLFGSRAWMRRRYPKPNGVALAVLALLAFGVLFVANLDAIEAIFSNPLSFTGRVAMWRVLVSYAEAHPLTGSGFQSFWILGARNPALAFDRGWIGFSAPHGHNGYLDTLATLGWPGLLMTILFLVLLPSRRVWRASHLPVDYRTLIGAWFFYTATQNLLESTWFSPTGSCLWAIWVMCAALLYRTNLSTEPRITHAARVTASGLPPSKARHRSAPINASNR